MSESHNSSTNNIEQQQGASSNNIAKSPNLLTPSISYSKPVHGEGSSSKGGSLLDRANIVATDILVQVPNPLRDSRRSEGSEKKESPPENKRRISRKPSADGITTGSRELRRMPSTDHGNPEKDENGKTKTSYASLGSSFSGGDSKSREFVESPWEKLLEIKGLIMSIISNSLLWVVLAQLHREEGLVVSFLGSIFAIAMGILIQVWMHISHSLTGTGINEATANIFGHYLSGTHGYSLAVCGYAHASVMKKLSFTNVLAYKSKCKPFLQRVSQLWMFHLFIIVFTVFSTTDIKASVLRVDKGSLSCVVYGEDGKPADRGFPNLHGVMGAGEYVFGTSLGHMRSQEPVEVTTHAFPPQLIDMFMDGTTIVGGGLLTDIFTECKCSLSSSKNDMIEAGVRSDHVDELLTKFNTLGDDLGFVNDIYFVNEDELAITTVINYRNSCGGTAQNSTPLPLCTTRLFNHRHAEIVASYMSDGSTSSVALKFIKIRKELEKANMTWVYDSLIHILGDQIAAHVTPESIPGSVSTLYWWTTVNLQTISPAYLSAGIETMWAMILRVAFQRTLSFEQTTCIQNIPDPTSMVLKMTDFGYIFGLIFVCGELLVNLVCLIACVPRFIETHPISPAIRINRDYTYFLLLLNGSFTAGILSECKSSVHIDDVWVKMDLNVRIGETIGTRDDPEKGNVTVDRPKFVTNLVRGKRYV